MKDESERSAMQDQISHIEQQMVENTRRRKQSELEVTYKVRLSFALPLGSRMHGKHDQACNRKNGHWTGMSLKMSLVCVCILCRVCEMGHPGLFERRQWYIGCAGGKGYSMS